MNPTPGICMTTDVDLYLNHMNNARVLREFDFGRIDHGFRTRSVVDLYERGGVFLMAGSTVRYRLPVKIFSIYKVVTAPVWWDSKTIYYDQRIITVSDGIVRACAYTKVVSTINLEEYFKEKHPEISKPSPESLPEDVKKWIESQEITKNNMNREREA